MKSFSERPSDGVCGKFEADGIVEDIDIWVVLFGLGDLGNLIYERHCLFEIFKLYLAKDLKVVDVFPSGNGRHVFQDGIRWQRQGSALTGYAMVFGKIHGSVGLKTFRIYVKYLSDDVAEDEGGECGAEHEPHRLSQFEEENSIINYGSVKCESGE